MAKRWKSRVTKSAGRYRQLALLDTGHDRRNCISKGRAENITYQHITRGANLAYLDFLLVKAY